MSTNRPTSIAATDALHARAYREGDEAHVEAVMAVGGFQTFVRGVWVGPDGKLLRRGVPCRMNRPKTLAPMRPVAGVFRATGGYARVLGAAPIAKRKHIATNQPSGRAPDRRLAILDLLANRPRTTPDIAGHLAMEGNELGKNLRRYIASGFVRLHASGGAGKANTYCITELGREWLADRLRASKPTPPDEARPRR